MVNKKCVRLHVCGHPFGKLSMRFTVCCVLACIYPAIAESIVEDLNHVKAFSPQLNP